MTDIEKVKERLDIVEVISGYMELKRAGANYKGLCPFHGEKTPSFMVNSNLQIFKCFGCGKGGDAITFIKEIERLDFYDALKIAAEKAGVTLSNTAFKKDEKLEKEKVRLIEANTITANFYHYILNTHKHGKQGRDYAQKRQLGANEIKAFQLGYAPAGRENLKNLLIKKGFNEEELVKFGLLVEREGKTIDKFRNRLLQPVKNAKGEVVGFSGRYIGESKDVPKYLNSPETLVFKKNELLYGLFEAGESIRKQKFVILVEGQIDVISSHRAKVKNIVAPLGTAFTPNQAKLLKRFADEIYFAFDNDEAGLNALIRSLKIVEDLEINHKTITIPEEFKDVDELICDNPKNWESTISEASNTIEYLLKKLEKGLDLGSADGKSKYRDRVMPILKSIQDEVQKAHFKKNIAAILGLSLEVMDEQIQNAKSLPLNHYDHQEHNAQPSKPNIQRPDLLLHEKRLLSLLLNFKNKLKYDFRIEHIRDHDLAELFEIIIETRGPIPKDIKETLSDEVIKKYEEISLTDSSNSDFEIETKDIYKFLQNELLRSQKEEADKKYINDSENDEYIKILNEIAKERKELSKL